jgi:hypothetical protein
MRKKITLSATETMLKIIDARARYLKKTRSSYLISLVLKDLEERLEILSDLERTGLQFSNSGAPIDNKNADKAEKP